MAINRRYSEYRMSLHGMLLPIMPGKIKFSYPGKNETVSLINGEEINFIRSPGLTEVEFSFYIPQFPYPFCRYRGEEVQTATYYLDRLEEMKKMKSPFKLKIIRKLLNKTALFDTSLQVTLEEYEVEENTENGTDLLVSVKCKQYRDFGAEKIKPKKGDGAGKKKKVTVEKMVTRSGKKKQKSYIVKEGDSLYKIAKKQLNNEKKRDDIYSLNKAIIEATAKKHGRASSSNGWWIYPGTKLKLPN